MLFPVYHLKSWNQVGYDHSHFLLHVDFCMILVFYTVLRKLTFNKCVVANGIKFTDHYYIATDIHLL